MGPCCRRNQRRRNLAPVALGADARVVRRQDDGDQPIRAGVHRLLDRGGNPRRPVLHAKVHGVDAAVGRIGVEPALQLASEVQRDGEQRRGQPHLAIAGREFFDGLPRRHPASADVGVIGFDLLEAVWTPIRHEQDGGVIRWHGRTP